MFLLIFSKSVIIIKVFQPLCPYNVHICVIFFKIKMIQKIFLKYKKCIPYKSTIMTLVQLNYYGVVQQKCDESDATEYIEDRNND